MHVTNDELPGFLANTMPAPSLCPDYRSSFGRQRDQCARSRVSKRAFPHEIRGSPDLQGNFASLLALFRLQVSLPQLLGSPGEPSTNTIMGLRYVGTRAQCQDMSSLLLQRQHRPGDKMRETQRCVSTASAQYTVGSLAHRSRSQSRTRGNPPEP